VDLAHQKQHASEFDDAIVFLQHAVEACPGYDAYQSLGELQAQSPQREDQAHAVDSFVSAFQYASSDAARASTLLSYARLLNQDGDPSNAFRIIKAAQTLDTKNPEITQLAAQIEQRINHPTKETLTRGLWDSLYKPIHLASAAPSLPVARKVEAAGRQAAPAGQDAEAKPADTLPINFETGSTTVDAQTRDNIATLAHALADPAHKDQHYVFVGHADVRGVEPDNVVLSTRRAEAIAQTVTLLEPSLRGRIEVSGKGSSEPLDPGNNEQAYRANRRLQVLLK
jgi:outer membrane protein OmpA-like peptidoglycan-associated protein